MLSGFEKLLICLFLAGISASSAYTTGDLERKGYYSPESTSDVPELVQQETGNDIRLKCGLKENPMNSLISLPVQWYFKPCGGSTNQFLCQDAITIDWTQLHCDVGYCRPTLFIRNATESNSGLYKCTMYPYDSNDLKKLRIQFVRIFQLEVKTILLPEFLDDLPGNTTVDVGSQVVFQCRVHSKAHLTIKWFRRLNASPIDSYDQTGIVQYSNKTYKLIESAGEKVLTEDIYLSKLILSGVNEMDTGFYACVPLNYRGHRIREAFLKVQYSEKYIEEKTHPLEFLLLFLMPLGLALVPLSLWFCFIFGKRYSKYKERHTERIEKKKNQQSNNYIRVQTDF